jgi:hypothetical protein
MFSPEQAQQSMLLFGIWETVFGAAFGARVRRVAHLKQGFSLGFFGTDMARIDTVAIAATFGDMCPLQPCAGLTELGSLDAPFVYAGRSVDGLLDVLRSTVLAAEFAWNQVTQIARAAAPERQVLGYTSGPNVQAAAYGWRNTWSGAYGALGCQCCLWGMMGVKFGSVGLLQRIGPDGWVQQESWSCLPPNAAPVSAPNRTHGFPGQFLAAAMPDECKRMCAAVPQCAGFNYDEAARVCTFVASVTLESSVFLPPGSANLAALGTGTIPASCYSRAMPAPAVTPATAWAVCGGRCYFFYAVPPLTAADLDLLASMAGNVTLGARLEQELEDGLAAANAHPRMEGIMMDALERFSRVAGPNGNVCLPPLYYRPGTWSFAEGFTKGAGMADFALRRTPTDTSAPKLQALRAWAAGAPQLLPFTAEAPPPDAGDAACVATGCVWGTCVDAVCACFAGYEGPDCGAVSAVRPANECLDPLVPVGMNLAGLCYWSTEWDYVDVFKKSGFSDYSGNHGWISQVSPRATRQAIAYCSSGCSTTAPPSNPPLPGHYHPAAPRSGPTLLIKRVGLLMG